MVLGQYVPVDSPVHNLNPTVKVVLLLVTMAALLGVGSAQGLGVMAALWITVSVSSRLSPRFVLRGLRPLLFLLMLTFCLHAFLKEGGTPMWAAGPLVLTWEGLSDAGFFTARLMLLVGFTTLLTLTTSPIELSGAIEILARPIGIVGLSAGEFAMMLTIALRFIPVLFREMDKIMKAQACRGAPFHRGPLAGRAKAYVSILVPLFINSFHRANELAIAMEIRGYRPGEPRTRFREHRFGVRDGAAVAVLGAFLAAAWNYR